MACKIEYKPLEEFALDSKNPRLGRKITAKELPQSGILKEIGGWSLYEIARYFIESNFWPHEAVLCIEDIVDGEKKLVVVEGNRRLASLIHLNDAWDGNPANKKWQELVEGKEKPTELFGQIPYIKLNQKSDVDAFLGFRHVTGIKEWRPAEKAEFISFLIDERGLSYEDVMRRIGSKTETVRRNYISFRVLQQMEETEGIDIEKVENKFSVLFLSLRSSEVQEFLGINLEAQPAEARQPIKPEKKENLREYTRWLFGDEDHEPVVTDSRQIYRFATVLASEESLEYLREVPRPKLDIAFKLSGGEVKELIEMMRIAALNIEDALSSIHLYKDDDQLKKAVKRLKADMIQIQTIFPED